MTLNIVQIVPSLSVSTGGPAVTVPSLASGLAEMDVQVSLFSEVLSNCSGKLSISLPPSHLVSTVLVERHRRRFFVSSFSLFRKVLFDFMRQGVDICHVNGVWHPIAHVAVAVAKELHVPLVVSPRGMLEPWALKQYFLKKKFAWWLYQRRDLMSVSLLHATSEQEADNIRRLGFTQPITVIPNGLKLNGLEAGVEITSKNRFCKQRKRTLLFLSRITPKKGLLDLVKAWKRIKPSYWHVLVAGPDESGHRAKVERLILSLGLMDDFSFLGEVAGEEKANLYRSADLFVLPTHSENFGLVIAEALTYAVPVITTRAAPWRDLEKFQCGWWVDDNVDGLTVALKDALNLPPDSLAEMGLRGRSYVQRYRWSKLSSQMLDSYSWLIGQSSLPACMRIS